MPQGYSRVGEGVAQSTAATHGVGQHLATARVKSDPCLGKRRRKRGDDLDLIGAGQHVPFELEVDEAVPFLRGTGQSDHGVGVEDGLAAQPGPGVGGVLVGEIGRVGPLRVTSEEEAKGRHPVMLPTLARQLCDGDTQGLAAQTQQRALERGEHVHGGAQIEGLQPTSYGLVEVLQLLVVAGLERRSTRWCG